MSEKAETAEAPASPKGEFRQCKPNKQWPDEIRYLIRSYVAAKGESLPVCPACGKKSRGRWTMLCPFVASGMGSGSCVLTDLGEHAPLTLVCSDHPIAPTSAIRGALR